MTILIYCDLVFMQQKFRTEFKLACFEYCMWELRNCKGEQRPTWEIMSWDWRVWNFLSKVAKEFIILKDNANSVRNFKNIFRGKAVAFSSRADAVSRKVAIRLTINSSPYSFP